MKTILMLLIFAISLVAFKIGQNYQERQYTPSEILEIYFPDNVLYADFLTKQIYFESTDEIINFRTSKAMIEYIGEYSAKKCDSIPVIKKIWL